MSFQDPASGDRHAPVACCIAAALIGIGCSPSGNAQHPKPAPAGDPPAPATTPRADAGPTTDAPAPAVGGNGTNTSGAWLTFRGTAQRTGRTNVKGPRRAKPRWVFRTQGRVYADAAVARDGTVYVGSHDGRLYAVGPDGRERWSYDAGGKVWTSPAIGRDDTIYLGSDADRLIALYPDGKERWVFSTAQEAPKGESFEDGRFDVDTSPALAADGSVIFGCHTTLFALRPSGGVRWVFEAGVGRSKIFSSPALGHDGSVYFGTQGRFFFALNGSAKVLWHLRTQGDNDATPTVGDDGTIYFGSDDGRLRAVAPGGTPRWTTEVGASIRAPLALGHDGTVYASTYGARPFIAAFDPASGVERWRFAIEPGEGDFYGIQSGALVDADGYIYFGGRDHYVYCLSPAGALVWRHRTGDQVDSSPVLGPDGTLYVGSDDKRMYAFAAD